MPYIYELIDEITGKWYIGSRTGARCYPEELGISYFSSSLTVQGLFRADPDRFKKKILLIGATDYVIEIEARLLRSLDARNNDLSFNMTNGDEDFNPVKVGQQAFLNKTGVHARSPAQMSLDGKKGGSKGGKIAAERNRQAGRAIFGMTSEQKSAAGRKGGPAGGRRGGKTQGPINAQNGNLERARAAIDWDKVRVKSRATMQKFTSEQRSFWAKGAAAKNWICETCGLAASAGTLGRHQRASGHRGKIRNTRETGEPA